MVSKTFEVRDAGTFIPVLAVKLTPGCDRDRYLLARTGYGSSAELQSQYVMVWRLSGGGPSNATTDLYEQTSDTMRYAHAHIEKNFDALESGAVVDVEFITGRSAKPKVSEEYT